MEKIKVKVIEATNHIDKVLSGAPSDDELQKLKDVNLITELVISLLRPRTYTVIRSIRHV